MEIDLHNSKPGDTAGIDERGLVIANTLIRKVDANADDEVKVNEVDTADLTWTKMTAAVKNNDDSDVSKYLVP